MRLKHLSLDDLEEAEREIEIFKAKYPWRAKEFERLVQKFMEGLTPETIIGPWEQ